MSKVRRADRIWHRLERCSCLTHCLAQEMVFASLASCQSDAPTSFVKRGREMAVIIGPRFKVLVPAIVDFLSRQGRLPLQGLDTKIDAIEAAFAAQQSHLFPPSKVPKLQHPPAF
jgi:hypothetical protein